MICIYINVYLYFQIFLLIYMILGSETPAYHMHDIQHQHQPHKKKKHFNEVSQIQTNKQKTKKKKKKNKIQSR